jgi:transglutaminase-like putative cysteine protease
MLFVLAAGIGQATHMGIAALQGQVEEWSTEILADFFSPKADPFRERTRIGDLGRIKLSDRIVMRVQVEGPRPDALLLRESAYERYRGGEWQSARREGRPAVREGDRWTLSDGSAPSRLALRRALPGGEGLLPLPLGTRSVDNLPAHAVEVFASGTVRARGTPRYLALGVAYDEGAEHDAPDAASDLEVPELVAGTFARVIEEERLRQPSPAATIDAVREFFDAKFSYSLELGEARSGAGGRTLADFLLRDRRGHCEYFATATVLLLRQAGIPARYVGGYSAQEYSVLEKAFVVRARHAHAWAIAWLDGRWVNLDTTPSRWAEFEGAAARGVLAPLLDRLSWMLERLLQAWMALSSGEIALIGAGVAAVLLLAPALVLAIRRRRARAPRHRRIDSDEVTLAWLRVERSVVRAGHGRAPGETARAWARRLADAGSGQAWRARLVALARDYYRARFDPAASPAQARAFLLAARGWKMTP